MRRQRALASGGCDMAARVRSSDRPGPFPLCRGPAEPRGGPGEAGQRPPAANALPLDGLGEVDLAAFGVASRADLEPPGLARP